MTEEQERAAEEFISGANEPPASGISASDNEKRSQRESSKGGEVYPWEEPQVRDDVKQTYPLRLPEPLHLKLKYLSEKTGKSMNRLCNEAVEGLVDEHLEEVL